MDGSVPGSDVAAALPEHLLQGKRAVVMLGPHLEARGGMATVAKNWQAAGFFARWRVRYIPTYRDSGRFGKLSVALLAFACFASLIARRRVALAHVHAASRMSFWRKAPFMALAYIARVPVVLHIHGGNFASFYERECNALQRYLIRRLTGRARRVLALSDYWREQFRGFCAPQHVAVVPNFVLAPPANPALARQRVQMLFLGQLAAAKGLRELFQAVALLRKEFASLQLVCAGDGDFDVVRKWMSEFGVADCVQLAGWVGVEQKWHLLRTCSLFVLPSHAEAMPVALLEAMAAGTACVATRVGAIPEIVADGVDGVLIEPQDVVALTSACRRLLQQTGLAQEMGQRAKQRVESRYAPQHCLSALEAVYCDALR